MRNVGYCEMYTGRKISKINITWPLLFPTFRNVGVYIDILMELVILKLIIIFMTKTIFSGFDIETVWNGNILIYLFFSYQFWRGVKITCFTFHICIIKHMKNSDAIAIFIFTVQNLITSALKFTMNINSLSNVHIFTKIT